MSKTKVSFEKGITVFLSTIIVVRMSDSRILGTFFLLRRKDVNIGFK